MATSSRGPSPVQSAFTPAPWSIELSGVPRAVNPIATLQEMVPVAKRRFGCSSAPRFLESKVGQSQTSPRVGTLPKLWLAATSALPRVQRFGD